MQILTYYIQHIRYVDKLPPWPRHPGDASPEPLRPRAAAGQGAAGGPHAAHLERLSEHGWVSGWGMMNGCENHGFFGNWDFGM